MKTFPSYREKYFLDPTNEEICLICPRTRNHDAQQVPLNSNGRASSAETRTTSCSGKDDYYRLQGKVMFSEASVSHSVHKAGGGDLSS